ncbi:MAG: enoyl-CoA hydratase/isomerase family protein [Halobacteria archaeon]|nr:enoyl-CoA hydratase/isomerase family protein [Halobacteria archaeon]
MSFETLDVSVDSGIGTIRINRGPVNAIDSTMRRELADALDILREDRVSVGIITGSGDVFSVGADVALFEEAQSWTTDSFRSNSRILGRTFDGLEELEKPVIAAINGTCVGGGLELGLACDIRIAAPDATLGFPEHNIGLIPGIGGCSRLVHLVGPGVAKDLIFTGRLIDGVEASEMGIVERVEDDPSEAAQEYAETLLEQPPQALGLAKRIVNHARDTNLRTAGMLESLAQSTLIKTEDHAEGIEAFREKRDPEFTGE